MTPVDIARLILARLHRTLELELDSGLRSVPASELESLPAPFLAVLSPDTACAMLDGAPTPADGSATHRLAVVLKCDGKRVLYVTEKVAAPTALPLPEFAAAYDGIVLVCAPHLQAASEGDAPAQPRERAAPRATPWAMAPSSRG